MMTNLYSWEARRAGAGISITHSTGKITNVQTITSNEHGQIIATKATGETYVLVSPPHIDQR